MSVVTSWNAKFTPWNGKYTDSMHTTCTMYITLQAKDVMLWRRQVLCHSHHGSNSTCVAYLKHKFSQVHRMESGKLPLLFQLAWGHRLRVQNIGTKAEKHLVIIFVMIVTLEILTLLLCFFSQALLTMWKSLSSEKQCSQVFIFFLPFFKKKQSLQFL